MLFEKNKLSYAAIYPNQQETAYLHEFPMLSLFSSVSGKLNAKEPDA